MQYDTHNISSNGIISVRMKKPDGTFHRYCLAPGDDLTGQPPEVVGAANEAWTQEVVDAYEAQKAANDPPEPTLEERAEQVRQQRRALYAAQDGPDDLMKKALEEETLGNAEAATTLRQQAVAMKAEIREQYPWPDD